MTFSFYFNKFSFKKSIATLIFSVAVFAVVLSSFTGVAGAGEHDDHGEAHTEEAAKGPHGGRLLSKDNFAVEVSIYETGVEPELRLYFYQDQQPIPAADVKTKLQASVTLNRLGEAAETINFTPELDYLLGDQIIREPHSFEVEVDVSYQGKSYDWHYDSFEGRTVLSERSVAKAAIELEQAGAGQIRTQLHLFGVVAAIPEQQYQVGAAYSGIVQNIAVKVGDQVKKGQILAQLQNPATLKNYSIIAPAAGEVTATFVNVGSKVSEQSIVEISDLSSVYVEMSAFPGDTEQLKIGDAFAVKDLHGHQSAQSSINYIAPQMTGGHIARARGVIANNDGHWRPGMHVKTDVTVATVDAPMVIKKSALQQWNDKTVIFIRVGDTFEIRMPELGRADDTQVEVLSGVPVGAIYATSNSFILKADVMKSGASHDH
ncbi:biotin/lipoyl-binding protein [Rheinheimera riviphila]|uniref:Biotin/lipoyl-binding protein n=1 Tax=Rheinheimera riviphila TaxID=1834037 RepID=A0A437QLI7_9GAMM|nr:efflux RND transporter periplasmic adaptor subunit [Rheinheimera riviphila]RVU35381.1 biotin/lipoyl-binding protein [Rheinheimera riviphila]